MESLHRRPGDAGRWATQQKRESGIMPLSEIERERIEKLFSEYCLGKVPPKFRDQIRIEFTIRGSEVKLFECRPRFNDLSNWTKQPIARFKKDAQKESWLLYSADRNGKWRLFEPNAESKEIETLLAEVQRDRTGIFWG
jgi:Protein of unknown function (DUF3024)